MPFDTVTPVLQPIRSSNLRTWAITTARRSSAVPDVPTLDEAGLKGFRIGFCNRTRRSALTPQRATVRYSTQRGMSRL
jgi:tripartite-type tricarboxylate transporter receptor subunit TctC